MKNLLFCLTFILLTPSALANLGVMVAGGNISAGYLDTTGSRHALFWAFDDNLLEEDNYQLRWQIELASSHWNNEYFPDIHAISLTPVFHYVWDYESFSIFAGGGIGATKLSADRLSSRNLGSKWLFEDKFVLGAEIFENHRLAISFNHYSNANLASENDGLSIWYLNYSYLW